MGRQDRALHKVRRDHRQDESQKRQGAQSADGGGGGARAQARRRARLRWVRVRTGMLHAAVNPVVG